MTRRAKSARPSLPDVVEARRELARELSVYQAGAGGYCSPRRRMPLNSRNEGSQRVSMPWRARAMSLADIARRVIGCRSARERRVELHVDDAAGDVSAVRIEQPVSRLAANAPVCSSLLRGRLEQSVASISGMP
jgi:hypothetical protein